MTYRPDENVRCRFFPYESLTIISCNGCVAVVRNPKTGETYGLPVGEITRNITGSRTHEG